MIRALEHEIATQQHLGVGLKRWPGSASFATSSDLGWYTSNPPHTS